MQSKLTPPLAVALLVGAAAAANAQQVSTGTSLRGARSSFSEGVNVSFGFGGRSGFSARMGNAGAVPPFGGFNPSAGARFGMATGFGGLSMSFSQGSSRSMISGSPVMTLPNGFPGFFFSGVQRPFVTGLVPAGGGLFDIAPWLPRDVPAMRHPEAGGARGPERTVVRAESAAAPPGATIDPLPPTRSERRRLAASRQSDQESKAGVFYKQAQQAERDGKTAAARVLYRMAAKSATGALRKLATEKLAALTTRPDPPSRDRQSETSRSTR